MKFMETGISAIKPLHMNISHLCTRVLMLVFLGFVGYAIANSIYVGSVMGIILGIISLCAGIIFALLYNRLQSIRKEEEPPSYQG